jgi:hypothetical protein
MVEGVFAMHEIKSFKIFQTARLIGVLYTIIGFIAAILFAILPVRHGYPGRGFMAIIFVPILYGILGFIFSAFFCWLYNEVASRIGGVAFELTPRIEN